MLLNFRILFNFIFPAFREYEIQILEAVAEQMDNNASEILSKQIKKVNYVQRHWEDKEVNFYCERINRKKIKRELRFPLDKLEVKLATVHLKATGESKKNKADIWLVRGFVFQIHFSNSPKKLKENSFEILKVEIHQNPMEKSEKYTSELGDSSQFHGWLKEWSQKYQISDIKKPLSKEDIHALIKEKNTKFPEDYLEIINQCEGFKINNWEILGISKVYIVNVNENEYLVVGICDSDADYLFVRAGSPAGSVYCQKHDDDEPDMMGDSLKEAIQKKIKN